MQILTLIPFLHSISDGWDVKCFRVKDNNPTSTHRPFLWGSQLSRLKWAVYFKSDHVLIIIGARYIAEIMRRKTPNNQSYGIITLAMDCSFSNHEVS